MKDSNTLAGNATRDLQKMEVLLNITGQFMKESNDLKIRPILLHTKGQYMKESNTLADNTTRILQVRNSHSTPNDST